MAWNPADSNPNITFSNFSLTLVDAGAAASYYGSRSTQSRSSGKWYFEIKLNTYADTTNNGIGIANATESTAFWTGQTVNSMGLFVIGQVYTGGVEASTTMPWHNVAQAVAGNIVGVAVDIDNLTIWWRKNDGTWLGTASSPNPSTNTNGFSFSGVGATVYPYVNFHTPADGITANFGQANFLNAAPSGFAAWEIEAKPLFPPHRTKSLIRR